MHAVKNILEDIKNIFRDKKARRTLEVLILLFVVAIIAVCCVVQSLRDARHNVFEYEDLDGFRACRSDMERLAKKLLQRFEGDFEQEDALAFIIVHPMGESLMITHFDENTDELSETTETAEPDIAAALKKITENAFQRKKGHFLDIRISRGQVAFTTYGPYSLVYSKKRPSYSYDALSKRNTSFYCSRVTYHWYRMIEEIAQ